MDDEALGTDMTSSLYVAFDAPRYIHEFMRSVYNL